MHACVQHAETQPLGASKENRILPSRYLGSPRFRLDTQMAEMHVQLRKVENQDVKVGMGKLTSEAEAGNASGAGALPGASE